MKLTEEQLMKMKDCVAENLHREINEIANNSTSVVNTQGIEHYRVIATIAARSVALSIAYLQEVLGVSFEVSG